MFKILETPVSLKATDLNKGLKNKIYRILSEQIKGVIFPKIGRIDDIIDIIEIQKGAVRDLDHEITFQVKYKVNVFKPEEGDIYEGTVKINTDAGILCTYNGIDIFIQGDKLDDDMEYSKGDKIKIRLLGVQLEDTITTYGEPI